MEIFKNTNFTSEHSERQSYSSPLLKETNPWKKKRKQGHTVQGFYFDQVMETEPKTELGLWNLVVNIDSVCDKQQKYSQKLRNLTFPGKKLLKYIVYAFLHEGEND